MEIDPDDLSNETDIKEVLRRLKNDYGQDASFILEEYNKMNDEGKIFLLDDLKKHYRKVGDGVKKEFDFSMDYVKSVYKDAFGLSQKRIDKLFKSKTSSKFKFYGWSTVIAFLISCLSFIAVVILLCINY